MSETKPFPVRRQLRRAGEPLHCAVVAHSDSVKHTSGILGSCKAQSQWAKSICFSHLIALTEILPIWLCWMLCVREGGCLGDAQGR